MSSLRRLAVGVWAASLAAFGLAASAPAVAAGPQHPMEVRVVVVTTFEVGRDSGDVPGEFQHWVERLPLATVLAFRRATIRSAPTRSSAC